MKKKLGIIVDGSNSFNDKELKQYDVKRLSFRIFNTNTNEEFRDEDLTEDMVRRALEQDQVFKTSCTPIGEVMLMFEEMLEEYEHIIVLPMHQGISSQANNIKLEANEHEGRIFVINPTLMNREIEVLVIKSRQLEKEGKSVEEIVETLNKLSEKSTTIFTTQSWHGVSGSGRFKSTVGNILNKLKIYPIISLQHATPSLFGLAKDYFGAIEKMINKFMKENSIKDINKIELMDLYSSLLDEDKIDYFKNWLSEKFKMNKEDILLEKNPITVTAYTGINAYGVSLRIKEESELNNSKESNETKQLKEEEPKKETKKKSTAKTKTTKK